MTLYQIIHFFNFWTRIGYSIAERLATEGAAVLVSSRREKNVSAAVEKLKSQGLNVEGVVCHVGNKEDRQNLFKTVNKILMLKYVYE